MPEAGGLSLVRQTWYTFSTDISQFTVNSNFPFS
jgi:hypothetical protein